MTECKTIFLICILAAACLSDIDSYTIPNHLIVSGLFSGLIFSFLEYGAQGIVISVIGAAGPMILLFVLFTIKVLGAADIKLLAVIGSFYNLRFILECIAISFIVAGIMSLYKMISQRELRKRILHVLVYIKKIMQRQDLISYQNLSSQYERNVINFSVAILIGYLITLVL